MSAIAEGLHWGLRRPHLARLGACAGCIALLGVGAHAVGTLAAEARRKAAYAAEDVLVATWRRAREATGKHRTIHDAVWARDHMAVAAVLLTRGEPDARDATYQTPLHTAALLGYDDIVGLLLAAGADLNARGNGGQTPLHNAAMANFSCGCMRVYRGDHAGRLRVIALLLRRGADVNVKNNQGWAPLHTAAAGHGRRALEVTRLLLANGADVEAKNKEGNAPLAVAKQNRCREAVTLLASYGAQ